MTNIGNNNGKALNSTKSNSAKSNLDKYKKFGEGALESFNAVKNIYGTFQNENSTGGDRLKALTNILLAFTG